MVLLKTLNPLVFLKFIQDTNSNKTQQFYYTITFNSTCFNCIELSSGLLENRHNVPTKCTINVDTLDLFAIKAWWWLNTVETCWIKCNCIIKLLCWTGNCILYENNVYLFILSIDTFQTYVYTNQRVQSQLCLDFIGCKLCVYQPVLRPSPEGHSTLTGMGKKLSTATQQYYCRH
jgi:hypothetical protein